VSSDCRPYNKLPSIGNLIRRSTNRPASGRADEWPREPLRDLGLIGLLSKGHPLGATGLAQCAELVWQLNGRAEKRQVEGARIALQHNVGLGGACVVTMYRKD
jgi:acetyl-CoA acetyltransferase